MFKRFAIWGLLAVLVLNTVSLAGAQWWQRQHRRQ